MDNGNITELHWQSHDVDIELQALANPELFPLVFK